MGLMITSTFYTPVNNSRKMIGQWEDRCNQVLLARFDPLVGDDEVIRVRILTETPADSSEDLASGFDSDCSYDSSA